MDQCTSAAPLVVPCPPARENNFNTSQDGVMGAGGGIKDHASASRDDLGDDEQYVLGQSRSPRRES